MAMVPAGPRSASYRGWREAVIQATVWVAPLLVAVAGAKREPGSWNDGGRLATVECLVDYGAFAIDESVFVKLPASRVADQAVPRAPPHPDSVRYDSKDRILVAGRFYSHRPPVLAVLLAGGYWAWERLTGFNARQQCDRFCFWMTLFSSGFAYTCSVAGTYYLGGAVRLATRWRLLLAGSLAFSTLALVYTRSVNDHIVLLAVSVAVMLLIARLSNRAEMARDRGTGIPRRLVSTLGALAGFAYTIDPGAGLPLLLATAALVAYRRPRAHAIGWFALGALPWCLAHHGLNYAIAGTLRPAGSVPDFFEWPGSPFGKENLTGLWHHDSFDSLAQYAFELLFGPRGFVLHNLPLFIAPVAVARVWRRLPCRRTDVVCTVGCCVATWTLYAALSNNYSGVCRSVRWFLPILGPVYYLLALGLRVESRLRFDLAVLTVFGAAGTAGAWLSGPWSTESVPWFWPSTVAGIAAWLLLIGLSRWAKRRPQPKYSPLTSERRIKLVLPEFAEAAVAARRSIWIVLGRSALTSAAVFVLLAATSPILPMAWDEGNAINRAEGIRDWFGNARHQGIAAFGEAEVARHWHYTVEIEGHPALYGIVIALGQWAAGSWAAPLTAARLGPIMLFSVAAGAMFHRLRRRYSLTAALAAIAALMAMPRLFAHAHFASFDGPLTSCWVLAWALFPTAESANSRGAPQRELAANLRALAWGVMVGAAMSCKCTGWLAPLPFVAYGVIYGNRQTAKTLVLGLVAAMGMFWLVNPRLWHHPVDGMQRFFDMNLHRAGTHHDHPTMFFGTVYNQLSGLPWYNTLVWTGITVPIGTLFLAAVGTIGAVRRWAADGQGLLLLLNWLTLIVVRALPGAPVHDAERLILPSFVFLAALAGVGCHHLLTWARATQLSRPWRPRLVVAGIVVAYASAAGSLLWYAPQWVSYYNLLIGGLRGADRAGMEATYYWDALDGEVLDWLHAHTPEGQKVAFSRPSFENLALLQRWGVLRRGWRPEEPGEYRWYVVQRRQTFWMPEDRWLVEHKTPAFAKTIRPPAWGFGPWRLDVPLIEVFSFEQRRRNGTDSASPHATAPAKRGYPVPK